MEKTAPVKELSSLKAFVRIELSKCYLLQIQIGLPRAYAQLGGLVLDNPDANECSMAKGLCKVLEDFRDFENNEQLLSSMEIITVHSMADHLVDGIIERIAVLDTEKFLRDGSEIKCTISLLKDPEAIKERLRKEALIEAGRIKRKSLPEKIGRIDAVLRQDKSRSSVNLPIDYERITAMDCLRHKIIHNGMKYISQNPAEDIQYLIEVTKWLLLKLASYFGLNIPPLEATIGRIEVVSENVPE